MSLEYAQLLEQQAAELRKQAAGQHAALRLPMFKTAPPLALPPQQLAPVPSDLQVFVREEVARALQQQAPPVNQIEQSLMVLLQQSIAPEEMEWVRQHIREGAPAFVPYVQSETMRTLMRMGYEAYREFLAGQRK